MQDKEILRELVGLHQKYPTLGLDSLFAMVRVKFLCGRNRVRRLMKQANIHSIRKKSYRKTTNSNHTNPIAPNLLNRDFNTPEPNRAWVSDITYIPTGEGWLYLAIVKDLCTKKVVGYSFSERIDTQLTLNALDMAVRRQKPKPGLIFHSDRGVQYASAAFRKALKSYKFIQSMSRKGDPYDNAVAENFFSCLKCECVFLRQFPTRSSAQAAIFSYIEAFYNRVRPHSGIGWSAPTTFETAFISNSA
jgi:transposase InsO family protein